MAPTYGRNRSVILMRMLDAPPEMVWLCWTDPHYLDWFFNPGMTPTEPTTLQLRPDGEWRQHMVVNADTQYMTGGAYKEIVPNRKLVFYWGAKGGWPELDPAQSPLITVELAAVSRQTRMDFRLDLPDQLSDEAAQAWLDMGIDKGWGMTIDRLVAKLQQQAAQQQ